MFETHTHTNARARAHTHTHTHTHTQECRHVRRQADKQDNITITVTHNYIRQYQ